MSRPLPAPSTQTYHGHASDPDMDNFFNSLVWDDDDRPAPIPPHPTLAFDIAVRHPQSVLDSPTPTPMKVSPNPDPALSTLIDRWPRLTQGVRSAILHLLHLLSLHRGAPVTSDPDADNFASSLRGSHGIPWSALRPCTA